MCDSHYRGFSTVNYQLGKGYPTTFGVIPELHGNSSSSAGLAQSSLGAEFSFTLWKEQWTL